MCNNRGRTILANRRGVGVKWGREASAWLKAKVQQLACMPRHRELVQGRMTHGEDTPVVRIEF